MKKGPAKKKPSKADARRATSGKSRTSKAKAEKKRKKLSTPQPGRAARKTRPSPPKPKKKPASKTKKAEPKKKPGPKPGKRPVISKIQTSKRRLIQASDKLQETVQKKRVSSADIIQAEALIAEAKKQSRQEETERDIRPKKVMAWRKRKHPEPSHNLRNFMEWRSNVDGTESGIVRWPIDEETGSDWSLMEHWLVEKGEELEWMDQEPVWVACAVIVGGVSGKDRDRYDRIFGRVAVMSTWRKTSELGATGDEAVGGLPALLVNYQLEVATNIIEKGYSIRGFTVMVHHGPMKPNGEFFGA
jgi:hypothetical protein